MTLVSKNGRNPEEGFLLFFVCRKMLCGENDYKYAKKKTYKNWYEFQFTILSNQDIIRTSDVIGFIIKQGGNKRKAEEKGNFVNKIRHGHRIVFLGEKI